MPCMPMARLTAAASLCRACHPAPKPASPSCFGSHSITCSLCVHSMRTHLAAPATCSSPTRLLTWLSYQRPVSCRPSSSVVLKWQRCTQWARRIATRLPLQLPWPTTQALTKVSSFALRCPSRSKTRAPASNAIYRMRFTRRGLPTPTARRIPLLRRPRLSLSLLLLPRVREIRPMVVSEVLARPRVVSEVPAKTPNAPGQGAICASETL